MANLGDLAGIYDFERTMMPRRPRVEVQCADSPFVQRLVTILSHIEYRQRSITWMVTIALDGRYNQPEPHTYCVAVRSTVTNVAAPGVLALQSSTAFIRDNMEEKEILKSVFFVLEHFERHECAEHFFYQGYKPFDPHK